MQCCYHAIAMCLPRSCRARAMVLTRCGHAISTPVAMAYLIPNFTALDTEVFAEVRGKKLPMKVTKMPFVAQSYYRG